jgi:Xaa-Pro aminopeptidase
MAQGITDMADSAFPVLSRHERDRRFALADRFMERHDLDVMILGQTANRIFQYFTTSQQYLSNEPNGQNAIVVLVRGSGPVLLAIRTQWGQIWADQREGAEPWISDYRLAEGGTNIISVLRDKGVRKGRVGLVLPPAGAGAYGPVQAGALSDPLWHWISGEFPDLEGVDVCLPFSLATLPKSDEELAIVRYLSRASDQALAAFVDAARIGATEIDLYAAAMEVFVQAGIDCGNIMIVPGHHPAGMGLPRFLLPNREIRKLAPGDVVITETFPVYAGIETQLSLAVHIGEPSKDALLAHRACQDAHDACLEAMRPGVSFHDVWQAMYNAVDAAGCWNWTPLIHSLSPMSWLGQQHHKLAERADLPPEVRLPTWPPAAPQHNHLPLEEGMIFAIEPGAATGLNRSRTGAVGLVTADGGTALTAVGTRLHVRE